MMASSETKKYQAYPDYKDSESEWLGKIPKHWVASKFSFLKTVLTDYTANGSFADLKMNVTYLDEPSYARLVRLTDLRHELENPNGVWINEKAYKYLDKSALFGGEFLLANVGAYAGLFYQMPEGKGLSSLAPNMFMAKFDESIVAPRFMAYVGQSENIASQLKLAATASSAQPKLNKDDFKAVRFAYPEVREQIQIANFLDHETAKIDTLIEKQKQLIKLLKEKRQAVISHAVTKGLNPKVPMKDSGVEWLGEVPEHWGVCKLKWKARTTSGGTPTTSKYELYYENGHIPWIRTTDLNNDLLYETPVKITPKAVNDTACSILPENSVLLAMYGGAGSIGKHSLLKFESTINQAVCGIFPSNTLIPEYLHRFYEYYRPFWMIGAAGTRKDPNIGQDDIKEAKVLIPPETEQKAISNHIDKMQNHFDLLTQQAENAIALMQERRTALISAVVTGKIDVRNWKKPIVSEEEVA